MLRRGLYLITRESADTRALARTVAAALDGGAVMVQYRDKSTDAARRLEQAETLSALCIAHGVPLIINDDVKLARACGARGVHLGEHDGEIATARAQLGLEALIGVSCYDDLERAHAAARQGASYIAFGSFFSSPTKPGARRAHRDLLRDSATLGLPRVAIGGITVDNAPALIAAGADMLAVISAIFDAPDPRRATQAFARLYEQVFHA